MKIGEGRSRELELGKYYVKELDTGSKYYLLNEEIYTVEILEDGDNKIITIANEETNTKVTVEKSGTIEIKPGDFVNYTFSNLGNASNTYLDEFKWFEYIPTNYIRIKSITTGTWNQDLLYKVYYKTNKSEDYILLKKDLKTSENYELDFKEIKLREYEYITELYFDFGRVDIGFKEIISPTIQAKSIEDIENGETFTNCTKTVGKYFDIISEAESKWTTVVHKLEEKHEKVLPRTGK